jgi:chromosome segregation ATPase
MTSATDKFSELETRILRTIELVKTTRLERERAERELQSARAIISRHEQELEQLRRERDLIKNRIESLVETLSEVTEETVV